MAQGGTDSRMDAPSGSDFQTAEDAALRALCDLFMWRGGVSEWKGPFLLAFSETEIANVLGKSKGTITPYVQKWVEQGWVKIDPRQYLSEGREVESNRILLLEAGYNVISRTTGKKQGFPKKITYHYPSPGSVQVRREAPDEDSTGP